MGEDVPTGLGVLQQKPPSGSSVIVLASTFRRVSAQFGWPILVIYFLLPVSPELSTRLHWMDFGLGAPALFLGLLLRLWSRGFARKEGFVFDGPYRYVRNPVELGALIAYAGAGTILGLEWWLNFLLVLVALCYVSFIAISYERELYSKAGAPYLRYAQRVRRWIPQQFPAANRSNMTYSVQSSLWRERESLIWMVGYVFVFAFRIRGGWLQLWLQR